MTSPPVAETDRPSLHDFRSGVLYSARTVARLFGRTPQWVRTMIVRRRLSAARLDGRGPWLVEGESVRALYGSLQLAADVAGDPPREESVDQAVRRARRALDELNRKPKGTP
jgi:hypothetical protein